MSPRYITTNPHSDFPLETGKTYAMDFDISSMPWSEVDSRGTLLSPMSLERLRSEFITALRERGHEVVNVVISIPHDEYYPNTLRFQFAIENPLLVIIIVAVAISIIAVGIGAGFGLYATFKGIVEIPTAVTETILKNPIAVIAILVAIAIFILGRKF